MGTRYSQIDLEERCRIKGIQQQGMAVTGIAHHLGRDRRTIQRQLSRNSNANGHYKPDSADRRAWVRRLRGSRIGRCSRLHESVTSALAMGWTPEQISGWLQRDHGAPVISHASIYRFIYSPAGRKLKLSRYLPYHHAKRGYRRRKGERKTPIPDRQGIKALNTGRKAPMNAVKQVIGRVIWSTSRAKATSCSHFKSASRATGSCRPFPSVTARRYPRQSSRLASPFQSHCAEPSPMTMAASLHGKKPLNRN